MTHPPIGKVRLSAAALAAAMCEALPTEGGVHGHEQSALAEINAAVTGLTTELRAALAEQKAELKKNGESTEATGKRIDEITAKLDQVEADRKAEFEKVQARIKEAEDHIARGAFRNGGGDRQESPGARFSNSEQVQALRKSASNESGAFNLGSFLPQAAIDGTTVGDVKEPDRRPGLIAPPDRPLTMRDLLNVLPTDRDTIEYLVRTGYVNNAATVAEGALKPQSDITIAKRSAAVEVIAHWFEITRQIIADAPRLARELDTTGRYGLTLAEEREILYGDGSTPNLQGIMTHPDIQHYAWSLGATNAAGVALPALEVPAEAGDTELDAIRRALILPRIAEYPSTGVIMNPRLWARIELLKASDNRYIWVSVNDGGVQRLWRVPVVDTNAMTNGEALVGAFGLGATLYDREETTVRTTESHADYFIRNKLVMLIEERVALTVERPESFVAIDFDAPPA